MSNFYQRRQNEILTTISIIVPLALSLIAGISIEDSIANQLPYIILIVGYIALGASVLYLQRSRKEVRSHSLSRAPKKAIERHRYRVSLDAATSCYFFLGMSAEEFQREIPIHDYFRERQARSSVPLRVKVLLLHPDSPYFSSKLHDANRDANLSEIVQRKKDIMRTLVHSFSTVPASAGTFEVRFYDGPTLWSMQLYDCSAQSGGSPDTLRIMPQLEGRHGKYSHVYQLDTSDQELFRPFYWYFTGLWDEALPLAEGGAFPDLFASSGSTVTTLAFDLDGTLVRSAEQKKAAYMHAMCAVAGADSATAERSYIEHGTENRVNLLRCSFIDLHGYDPSRAELDGLVDAYTIHYRQHNNEVDLFPGFKDFFERFKHRYRCVIVSNAPKTEIVEMLERFGVSDYFVKVYGYPVSKVAALREIFTEFSLEPGAIMYVGDRPEDRWVAESVGTRFQRLAPAGPTSLADPALSSLSELAAVLFDLDIGIDY